MMTPQEAVDYIENYGWSKTRLGLDRTRELLHRLGDPQKELKFVHVAGSNGKGSTCAMLDSILRHGGYRVGLYTSPYIQEFRERIQVNGEYIPGEELARLTEKVRAEAEQMDDHPSQFELVTALAFVYFAERDCDIVVLEVGMGGELDSTNVIDAPEVAVICNITLEHTEYLGSTIPEIARTKAGIIKSGCTCVSYDGDPEAKEVVAKVCDEKNVPLRQVDSKKIRYISGGLTGQRFGYGDREYDLSLLGPHQLQNAAVALEAVEALREKGWLISEKTVQEGLREVRWPARMEILGMNPLFFLDGGHNPQCARALRASLNQMVPDHKFVMILGILADKDYGKMLDILLPAAQEVVCVTPDNAERALPGNQLAALITERGVHAVEAASPEDGINKALDLAGPDGRIVSFGSLYLAGPVRTAYRPVFRKWVRKYCLAQRRALTTEEREEKSRAICRRIAGSKEFRSAGMVMIYRALPDEVDLDSLAQAFPDKRFVYPLCTSSTEMVVLDPQKGWQTGHFGIQEPIYDESLVVDPSEIDQVICPGSAFDTRCHRMGMGAGYYDRYLSKCRNASIVEAAFECQKYPLIPTDPWDHPMKAVFTEDRVYSR